MAVVAVPGRRRARTLSIPRYVDTTRVARISPDTDRPDTDRPKPLAPSDLPIRDRSDRWIVASAMAGEADMLVTGDQDLLVVADGAPLPILSLRAAWERLSRPV